MCFDWKNVRGKNKGVVIKTGITRYPISIDKFLMSDIDRYILQMNMSPFYDGNITDAKVTEVIISKSLMWKAYRISIFWSKNKT